jgi:hypothetical protein
MDGNQQFWIRFWIVWFIGLPILASAIIWPCSLSIEACTRLYIESGYEQSSVPGIDGRVWVKIRDDGK